MSVSSPSAPIRVVTFGARHALGQLNRIDTGLLTHGVALCRAEDRFPVDLVYANDEPRWQEALDYRAQHSPSAKVMLCVLDVGEWNLARSSYNPYSLLPRLRQADAICSISQYVQSQLIRYFRMDSNVIYNPIKDVSPTQRLAGHRPYPQFRAMMLGRLTDPVKRADLAIKALILAGFSESEVAVCGGENVGWGTNLGTVSDEILNDLYNSVDYVVCTSLGAGLELPPLEGMAAGAIPIVCHDLTTFSEFYPMDWGCYPVAHSIAYRLRLLTDYPDLMQSTKTRALDIGANVSDILAGHAVAKRILSVYHRLIKPLQEPVSA